MKRRFTNTAFPHNKFWEIEQKGCELHLRWGRLDNDISSFYTKGFISYEDASAFKEKKIREKLRNGYVEQPEFSKTRFLREADRLLEKIRVQKGIVSSNWPYFSSDPYTAAKEMYNLIHKYVGA